MTEYLFAPKKIFFRLKLPSIEHYEIVEYLVEHGADINSKDYYERTVFMNACNKGNLEMVKF
jgi:ankyrin repeat protein